MSTLSGRSGTYCWTKAISTAASDMVSGGPVQGLSHILCYHYNGVQACSMLNCLNIHIISSYVSICAAPACMPI
jgi:hypothetical protein